MLPEAPAGLIAPQGEAVCYVLEYGGLADRIALQLVCRRLELPEPATEFTLPGISEPRSMIRLRRFRGWIARTPSPEVSPRLSRITAAAAANSEPIHFVPVGIYWGRAPEKESGFFKLAFSERWEIAGRLRKLMATFFLGRSTLVQFSEPLRYQEIAAEQLRPDISARKVSRILRVHFRQRREAVLGPDLSHRRTLVDRIVLEPSVRNAISNRASSRGISTATATRNARRYAHEIAADVSYPTIRILDRVLARIWNRLYDGVRLMGQERLHAVADGNEIIYVPCHRSHMDYLLLSYVIYHEGLSIPHIAAGVNLNLPVIGSVLRRGGAFFLRRSFKGNRLYAAVFNAYLRQLQQRGFSLEYFIEGGRSRTGRLLEPRTGMLTMSIAGFATDPQRPIYFVPVYFGYEKLLEGRSFVSELEGHEKQRESLWALFRSLKKLREKFGQVYVNFGEPISLAEHLDKQVADWRDQNPQDTEARPEWLGDAADSLAEKIMRGISAAAAPTPVALVATALLGTPRQSMAESDLAKQLAFYQRLMQALPYSGTVVVPEDEPAAMIEHALALGVVAKESHDLGDILVMEETQAVLATYFRNNIGHLFVVPASVACAFMNGQRASLAQIERIVRLSYPYLAAELTMEPGLTDLDQEIHAAVRFLVDEGLLVEADDDGYLTGAPGGSAGAFKLHVLGNSLVPALQRFYLTIALLFRAGQGGLTPTELERVSELCAQRLAKTFGLRSPDFFDKRLFQRFVRALLHNRVIWRDSDGKLAFADGLERIQDDARRILGEQVHHSILGAVLAPPGDAES